MTESTPNQATDGLPKAEHAEAIRLGHALRIMRTRVGISRQAAGEKIDITAEGWARYERGQSPGIFRPGVQDRLTQAIGQTPDDLREEAARVAAANPVQAGLPDARP